MKILRTKFNWKTFLKFACCLLAIFGKLAFSQVSFAQIYTATAKLDTNKILLGDQAILTLNIRIPKENTNKSNFLKWHALSDTLSEKIEIIEKSKIDTSLSTDQKTLLLTQKIAITSFDSGFIVLPPIRFLRNGDSLKYIETQALLLEVIVPLVDTTADIIDIKAPLEIPFSFMEILPQILLWAGISAVLLLLILYFLKRRKKTIPTIEEIKSLSPHEKALNLLLELNSKNLWQQGKTKEYYVELTDILRVYIEERFSLGAMELTSDEILIAFRSIDIQSEIKDKLKQILTLADLVKFAKINPLPAENNLCYSSALEIVNDTTVHIETETASNKGGEL